jgi:intracellular septation protein A
MAVRREIANLILINAIAPYIVYQLAEPHTGGVIALALSAVPPAIESVWSVVRKRKLDIASVLVLGGIAVSLVLIALGGSERVLLLRDSLITSVVGLAIAISAVFRRPIFYYLFRQLQGVEPDLRTMRVLSIVMGLGLVVEMAVRTAMVYAMTTSRFLLISPFVQYGMTGLLVAWAVFYMRRHARRIHRAEDHQPV